MERSLIVAEIEEFCRQRQCVNRLVVASGEGPFRLVLLRLLGRRLGNGFHRCRGWSSEACLWRRDWFRGDFCPVPSTLCAGPGQQLAETEAQLADLLRRRVAGAVSLGNALGAFCREGLAKRLEPCQFLAQLLQAGLRILRGFSSSPGPSLGTRSKRGRGIRSADERRLKNRRIVSRHRDRTHKQSQPGNLWKHGTVFIGIL